MTTLFEKYGGFASVSKIVFAFYESAIESDIIGPYFETVDVRRLVDHQTKFIASVMGGPASYSDEALRAVHAPHKIERAAFDEMARLLRQTLEEFDVENQDVDQVIGEIAARMDVVVTPVAA